MPAGEIAVPTLSAETVLDALIREFALPVPPLVSDPLGYFAKMLEDIAPKKEGTRREVYCFDEVISRIKHADELLQKETSERRDQAPPRSFSQVLGKMRDALRVSRYEDAIRVALEIKLSSLGKGQLRDLQEVMWSAALGVSDNLEAEAQAYGLCVEAIRKLSTLGEMDDGLRARWAGALNNWGNALSNLAKTKQGEEADRLFQEACEKYRAARRIKLDMHEALYNWGNVLFDWAVTKQGEEADRLFREACKKYEAALKVKRDLYEALYNWGNALLVWADTKEAEEADCLFREACEKYRAALKVKPGLHEALNNWGNALLGLAKRKQGAEADRLFQEACEKYEAALKVKPGLHEALYNWGTALCAWAVSKQGEEADRLFKKACERFEAARKAKPDMHEALISWGMALCYWARTKQGNEADELFAEARTKLLEAERIVEGSATYDLACLAALQGKPDECHHWLDVCAQKGKLPPCKHIMADSDLESVRGEAWFTAILSRAKD